MKRILVTGGAGFIGSNLCEKLVVEFNHVICLDNLYTGNLENIKHLFNYSNFEFIYHDIIHPICIEGNIDQIYNLACPASPPKYQIDPIYTLQINFQGVLNILEFAKKKMLLFYNLPLLKYMANLKYLLRMKVIEEM